MSRNSGQLVQRYAIDWTVSGCHLCASILSTRLEPYARLERSRTLNEHRRSTIRGLSLPPCAVTSLYAYSSENLERDRSAWKCDPLSVAIFNRSRDKGLIGSTSCRLLSRPITSHYRKKKRKTKKMNDISLINAHTSQYTILINLPPQRNYNALDQRKDRRKTVLVFTSRPRLKFKPRSRRSSRYATEGR